MDIEKLKALALAATPQNFDSAKHKREGGWIECPTCGGDGAVSLGSDYCNYDGAAVGVQFYGIGDEHVKAEAYYRAANPATVLDLIAEVELLWRERAILGRGFGELTTRTMELSAEIERLRAAQTNSSSNSSSNCAAPAAGTVEKDAERLDWLERTNQTFCGNYSNTGFRAIGSSLWHGTLREAIDGAMLEEAAIEAHNARSPSCGS